MRLAARFGQKEHYSEEEYETIFKELAEARAR
jgi:hypothetical protein